ncbi:MAG: Glu-tRNA(Gln) amidotransferase subunit GatE [Candidatus Lokiarchaeota archaeon]|nr:Glu-tRNA(Gln) amidotransferase subunit GatE [Candidatus Lokiarchaeota archaeon]
MKQYNYKDLGFKCGLEIHQQLDTNTKLFCRCPTNLQGTREPDFTLKRLMRPVLGEMGEFDKAMITEYEKRMSVVYEGYDDVICTYEMDETPPFLCNNEARRLALEIALLLRSNIIEEMHVCRKNYLDGSVPCGFQRTMILGTDGFVELKNGKKIGIDILSLEEESARKIKTENKINYFRLDRLGIPLIEITTKPDINHPDECRECAERLGLLLWSTKVKKIIGSVRQDVNVSIKQGTRIELKGVQKLGWIPTLINHEISRQLGLIEIKDELNKKKLNLKNIPKAPTDLTDPLKSLSSDIVKQAIKSGKKIYGINLTGFNGILGKELMDNYRFGTEISSKVKSISGIRGIIHSDEDLSKYNFSKDDIKKIQEILSSRINDCFVLVIGSINEVEKAMEVIIDRVIQAFLGVPPETRRALENGNSEFLRELHGGARIYPDTDSKAIFNDPKEAAIIKENLPKYPWDTIEDYSEKYDISEKFIKKLIFKGLLNLFERLIRIFPDNPSIIINTILEITTALRRDGKNVENITNTDFEVIFKKLKEKEISKEAIEEIMISKADSPELSIEEIIDKLNIEKMSLEQLIEIIEKIAGGNIEMIKSKEMRAIGPLMGEVMKLVRGKIDGAIVSRELKNIIQKKLEAIK